MSTPELATHFEELHRSSTDPWSVDTRWYERRKRRLSVDLLCESTYARGFELGCSVGAVTELLADRCTDLLAWDSSAAAVEATRRRLADRPNVRVEERTVPGAWPAGSFDLIVASEVGYYLRPADLDLAMARAHRSLLPGGNLLAVHWRHAADDFLIAGGDEVHDRIQATAGLEVVASYVDPQFRGDVFVRSA